MTMPPEMPPPSREPTGVHDIVLPKGPKEEIVANPPPKSGPVRRFWRWFRLWLTRLPPLQ
jgi:hypothetical protein